LIAANSSLPAERDSLPAAPVRPCALHARFVASLALQSEVPPRWFTAELVAAVRLRLRELLGRWRATRYGASLELDWRGGGEACPRGAPREP
jgi:hypothetical protein